MTSTTGKTIGEIVAQNPASARVFESFHLDYCCGGKMALAEACAARGIDPAEVEAALERAAASGGGEERDWTASELGALIDHILGTHHLYLKSELPRLAMLLDKVLAAHGASHGESLGRLDATFRDLRSELEAHLMKEEMVLFPMIRGLEAARKAGRRPQPMHCGSVNNPIRMMEHEHDSAGAALAAMRQATDDYTLPAGACNTYRALFEGFEALEADLHQHIHLENNILFPRAAALE